MRSSFPHVLRVGTASALVVAMLVHETFAHAEPKAAPVADGGPPEKRTGFAVMLGMGQWALGGGNVAVQYNIGPLALEYSHGQGVHLSEADFLRNRSEKDAGADVHETWTTGLGVGVLVLHDLRLLLELKANHYELEGGDRNSRLSYTTFTIGPGVFYDIHLWNGLFIQPSVRWWPTVHSTMSDGAALRRADGTQVQITSHESGVFPNLDVGWEF
jgi:hypothetical protein